MQILKVSVVEEECFVLVERDCRARVVVKDMECLGCESVGAGAVQ